MPGDIAHRVDARRTARLVQVRGDEPLAVELHGGARMSEFIHQRAAPDRPQHAIEGTQHPSVLRAQLECAVRPLTE